MPDDLSPATIPLIIAAVSSLFAFLAAAASWRQAQAAKQGIMIQEQSSRVHALLDVRDRWTDCLPHLYQFRHNADNFRNIRQKYSTVQEFMASPEWGQMLRPICNFYEFIGVLAHHKILQKDTILVFVTVNPADRQVADEAIKWLREDYRDDIYLYWDWLVENCEKCKACNPYKKSGKLSL